MKVKMNNPLKLDETPKVKRNIFLTILLLLIFTANLLVAGSYILTLLKAAGGEMPATPSWLAIFGLFVCFGNIVCAIAVWVWKKWGLIGFDILVASAYIVTGIATHDFSSFYALVGAIILTILVFPYWKFMK